MADHADNLEEFYGDDHLINWRPLEISIRAKVSILRSIEADEPELAELEAEGKGKSRKAERVRASLGKSRTELGVIDKGLVDQNSELLQELQKAM